MPNQAALRFEMEGGLEMLGDTGVSGSHVGWRPRISHPAAAWCWQVHGWAMVSDNHIGEKSVYAAVLVANFACYGVTRR